jgi:hypothetical protein
MAMPNTAKDTGRSIFGLRTYTDETIPNCNRCLVIGSHHAKTNEIGYFAFCKKSGKLERVGPYKSYFEALKTLTLTKDVILAVTISLKQKVNIFHCLMKNSKRKCMLFTERAMS